MSLFKSFSRRVLAVLDFQENTVSALLAEQKEGRLRCLGLGESPAQGVSAGRVENIGDAVECVVEAARAAQRQAGQAAGTVYYNFFDPALESVVARGSKILSGEGQVRESDLRDVRQVAARAVGHFEKNIIYARDVGFTIDDRDFVLNPLGVFGRKVAVERRVLLSSSASQDAWDRVMARAQIRRAVPVISSWSTAYGVLPRDDRSRPRLIASYSQGALKVFTFGNNMIGEHRALVFEPGSSPTERAAKAMEFLRTLEWDGHPFEQVLLTGQPLFQTEALADLREWFKKPLAPAKPAAIAGLEDSARADLVGLALVADELEGSRPILHEERGVLPGLKAKAKSFFNDYF